MRPRFAPTGRAPPLRADGSGVGVFGWSVVALIIVGVGRVTEFVPVLRGAPLAKVAIGLALLAYWTGKARTPSTIPFLSSPSCRTAAALGALAVCSLAFSVWKSETLQVIMESTAVAAEFWLIFRAVCDWRSVRRLSAAVTVSAGALALTALLCYSGGRAAVQSSYDTNDLAYVLVTALPIGYGMAVTSKGLRWALWLAVCAVSVITVILTGSRGGAIGLGAVVLCLLAMSTTRPKRKDGKTYRARVVMAVLALAAAGLISWPMLPAQTRERLATFTDLGNDYNMQSGQGDSRTDIWGRSMKSLLQRPIGFGMGAFGVVDMMTGGQFRAAHNSEVQIAVELGFLGLFLYLRMQWLSWTTLGRLVELGRADGSVAATERGIMAANLRVSLVGNFTAGFFLSQAYSNLVWLLLGLIAGIATTCPQPKTVTRAAARV
jgi:O-antigen ligase